MPYVIKSSQGWGYLIAEDYKGPDLSWSSVNVDNWHLYRGYYTTDITQAQQFETHRKAMSATIDSKFIGEDVVEYYQEFLTGGFLELINQKE